jgi:hypothetical protein
MGMGGSVGMGGSMGAGGVTDPGPMVGFARPKGTIPNKPMPATMINASNSDCKANWQKGILSTTPMEASPQPRGEDGHHNQPAVLNGYLHLNGNAGFSIYDISDPGNPRRLSHFVSPNDCKDCGPKKEGEAESHTAAYARYGDKFYTATISGVGIDLWEVTDPTKPQLLKAMTLDCEMPGAKPNCINFGDFTEAVWGIYWQGETIYVGGTNTGIHIIDAKDPANPKVVKRLPTSAFGGVNAGPIYAMGNVLMVITPKENSGIATFDISDPFNPITLASFKTTQTSYIGQYYRHFAFEVSSSGPLRAWDVLTDPTNIGAPDKPIGTLATQHSEYMSFSDNKMFLGHALPEPGATKIDVSDPTKMKLENRICGRYNLSNLNDDQFTVAVGNLLVLSDDQAPYFGSVFAVHSPDPDKLPPVVDTIVPKDGATGQALKSRVGISFTDNIELATVNVASFIVRPVGGQPIAGKWGSEMGFVNFDPDQDLQPKTTYEVILPKGGITDFVGNGLAEDFKSTFTTK